MEHMEHMDTRNYPEHKKERIILASAHQLIMIQCVGVGLQCYIECGYTAYALGSLVCANCYSACYSGIRCLRMCAGYVA